ncbi:BrxA family protein [Clostridium sp. JS66]|uniref:BrxA family protein n=1 Tax=Clostridium sp. JS66 TaxID=3064705 RepID=UPI00298EB748|nr:BrxA family protein [Clostridium sp. JS66]WPC40066.1 DUF1819 family protein [Clostridium sp. JS66]
MEQIKWTTVSAWVDETLELFKYIDDKFDLLEISEKIKSGEIFGDRKVNSAKRVFEAIKARYLRNDKERILALSKILNSNISAQEKNNYLLVFYLEYETLAKLFMETYIYENFNNFSQKVFTQMDLDRFFEIVFEEHSEMLPSKLKGCISESSMTKVRNTLYKNIESFGWIDSSEDKITIKRPSLTPEWFVFTLYLYFDGECISAKEVYTSPIYKRFLLNEFDIEYLITGAKIKGLIDTNKLGDINTITKHKMGVLDYAENYK